MDDKDASKTNKTDRRKEREILIGTVIQPQLSSPSLAEPLITLVSATASHSSFSQSHLETESDPQTQSQSQSQSHSHSQSENQESGHLGGSKSKSKRNLTVDMGERGYSSFKDRNDVERIRQKMEHLSSSPSPRSARYSSPATTTTPNTANPIYQTENQIIYNNNTYSQGSDVDSTDRPFSLTPITGSSSKKSPSVNVGMSTESAIEKDPQPRSAADSSSYSKNSLVSDDDGGQYRTRRHDLEIISETAFDRVARSLKQQLLVRLN
jgi:hypothetical protein